MVTTAGSTGALRGLGQLVVATLLLAGCGEQDDAQGQDAAPVRGLVTTVVQAAEASIVRRYPGVLEPQEITSLSFEVAGKLGKIDLTVGQRVAAGKVLARLDSEQFELEIENKTAALEEVAATLAQAEEDLVRSEGLFAKGVVTKVRRDEDRTEVIETRAKLTQAEKALETARQDLEETVMLAPFEGIINTVDQDSFATVGVGTVVTSLYDASAYEVSFSVNFESIAQLAVGAPAVVRLADDPAVALAAVVSELGERANTVSSFPVVVALTEDHPLIRAGMAVEVSFEFQVPGGRGYLIPISAAITEGEAPEVAGRTAPVPLGVFVYDPESGTVRRREVTMAGLRGNQFLVIEGLAPGERVATAGVAFLRDGMPVRPLEPGD